MTQYDNPYKVLVASGAKIDNHESDLYVEATEETRRIIAASKWTFSAFTSQVDGKRWYEVPFAYEPWWEARQAKVTR